MYKYGIFNVWGGVANWKSHFNGIYSFESQVALNKISPVQRLCAGIVLIRNGKFGKHSKLKIDQLGLPLRIAKSSGFCDLSVESSLLFEERSIQFFASEMQAVRSQEGKSKEAASAHMLSCIIFKFGWISKKLR